MFPESFYSFLYNYVASLNEPSSEALSAGAFHSQMNTPLLSAGFPSAGLSGSGVNATFRSTVSTSSNNTSIATAALGPGSTPQPTDLLPSDSDHRVERIWADYESIEAYITHEAPVQEEKKQMESLRRESDEGLTKGVKVEYIAGSGPGQGSRSGKAFQVCVGFLFLHSYQLLG